jgi:hypothetical protein
MKILILRVRESIMEKKVTTNFDLSQGSSAGESEFTEEK